jgi:hypothetical protein
LSQGDAEIKDFRAVRRQKDVGRLEISVRDAAAVQGFERIEDFEANLHGLRDRQCAATETCRQRFPLQPLHRHEQPSIGLADFVQLTDVRMIDAGGEASLAPETLACCRISGALVSKHFHRDRPFQLFVKRRVDHAHAAFTQRVGDTVPANACWQHGHRELSLASGAELCFGKAAIVTM